MFRIFLLALLALGSSALRKHSLRDPVTHRRANTLASAPSLYKYNTNYFNVKLDHFTYSDTRTFPMRYLYNNTFYSPGGPIFFYTGNEGDIEGFATATGIMWDLAPIFKASIIFAEHRFYGETLPFKNDSYSTISNMGYLTSEQALQDYADFITALKTPNTIPNLSFDPSTPVIAFGGSYGGMLSAWFRMKYPHIVAGAWASSAPLLYFENGGIPVGAFDSITTRTFNDSGCNYYVIANVWNAVETLSGTESGRQFLNQLFHPNPLISSPSDGVYLNEFIQEAFEYMAMVDYTYPTSFLEPMPGLPVRYACQNYLNATGTNFTNEQMVTMVAGAISVYYNFTGNTSSYCIDYNICGDQGTASLGSPLGWPWQECSEIVMNMCSQGPPNDFFWNQCGNGSIQVLQESCNYTFAGFGWTSQVLNVRAVEVLYGLTLNSTSNIILTQGHLDPWSGGGYKDGQRGALQSRGIYAIEIPGSAHHLDLRLPNTCDPNTISNARYQIVQILKCWIDPKCSQSPAWKSLPNLQYSSVLQNQCADSVGAYPWGQTSSSSLSFSILISALLFITNLF